MESDESVSQSEEFDSDDINTGKETLPSFKLLRGEEDIVETIQFTPKSLMTVFVYNTGKLEMTSLTIKDQNQQVRYKSSNIGNNHEFVVRVQNTRSFGKWSIIIFGPMFDEKSEFKLEIPFFVINKIDLENDRSCDEAIINEMSKSSIKSERLIQNISTSPFFEQNFDRNEEVERAQNEENLLFEVMKDELNSTIIRPTLILFRPEEIWDNIKNLTEEKIIRTELNEIFELHKQDIREKAGDIDIINENDVQKRERQEKENIIENSNLENNNILFKNKDKTEINVEKLDAEIEEIDFDDDFHIQKIMEELKAANISEVRDLFIPLDEIESIEPKTLNILNQNEIFYIEEFLTESVTNLVKLTNSTIEEVLEIQTKIKIIIKDPSHDIRIKYKKFGEIKDNTLYYSTIKINELAGIGEHTYQRFNKAGIVNITDLANSSIKHVSELTGFSVKKVVEFIVEAKSLVYTRVTLIDYDYQDYYPVDQYTKVTETSQLDAISTIKLHEMNKMYGLSINNLGKLANSDPVKISKDLAIPLSTIISWIFEAQIMIKNRVSIQFRAI